MQSCLQHRLNTQNTWPDFNSKRGGYIMSYPKVGILVNSLVYSYIEQGKSGFEQISFYEKAAELHKVSICFFRLNDISLRMNRIIALVKTNNGSYIKKNIPIPRVIHNRGLFPIKAKRKIKLLQEKGIQIFNEWNRIPKFKVHSLLLEKHELQKHLPETAAATGENFQRMIDSYKELIIKRNSGTLGNGVIKVSSEKGKLIVQYRKNGRWKKSHFLTRLPEKMKSVILTNKYIIQERIPLATYKSNPFDLRVSVQKNETGHWQVSGIVGKVAESGSFLTNVAQGGKCYTLEELLIDLPHLEHEKVQKEIETLGIEVAKQLEQNIPTLADIGLDIGITNTGFPMFIECNCRDLRYSFGLANLYDQWEEIYEAPIGYAKYLLDLMKKE